MKKWVAVALAMAMAMLLTEPQLSTAVNCSPTELRPCLPALTSSAQPTSACCGKLKQQQPCLCGYLKDPALKQYVNSPGAKRVASACKVGTPRC